MSRMLNLAGSLALCAVLSSLSGCGGSDKKVIEPYSDVAMPKPQTEPTKKAVKVQTTSESQQKLVATPTPRPTPSPRPVPTMGPEEAKARSAAMLKSLSRDLSTLATRANDRLTTDDLIEIRASIIVFSNAATYAPFAKGDQKEVIMEKTYYLSRLLKNALDNQTSGSVSKALIDASKAVKDLEQMTEAPTDR